MRRDSLHLGGDFFSQMAARDPLSRRLRRLFERGIIASISGDSATVSVGRREDGSEILLEEVPIVSGYNPKAGDWVTLRYDGGHGGAPMVFGPSVSDESEEPPSTSSEEVIQARSSTRYGAHASLDGRLEEHEQDNTDPHGSSLEQTVKVRTPLLDSAGNLRLLPADSCSVIVGDGAIGGKFRPLVIADKDYQALDSGEWLKIMGQPALSLAYSVPASLYFLPANTDPTRRMSGFAVQVRFTGNNLVGPNSEVQNFGLTFDGSAIFPSPGSGQPLSAFDVNLWAGSNFTGQVPKVVGLWCHPQYDAAATGTFGEIAFFDGAGGSVFPSGKVSKWTWFSLRNLTNIPDFAHFRLETGKIEASGDINFHGDDAAQRTWNIGKTSGTYSDLVNLGNTKFAYGSEATPAADNLVRNANFEYDLDGDSLPDYWSALGDGFTRATSEAHMGKYAISLNKAGGGYAGALHNDYLPVDTHLVYEMRAEWYCDAANDGANTAMSLWLECYDGDKAYLGATRVYWTGSTSVQRTVFRLTSEAAGGIGTYRFATGTRFVRVRVGNHGAANSKTYVRWVEFKPVWRWSGSATTGSNQQGGGYPVVVSDPCIRSEDYIVATHRDDSMPNPAVPRIISAGRVTNLSSFRIVSSAAEIPVNYAVMKAN